MQPCKDEAIKTCLPKKKGYNGDRKYFKCYQKYKKDVCYANLKKAEDKLDDMLIDLAVKQCDKHCQWMSGDNYRTCTSACYKCNACEIAKTQGEKVMCRAKYGCKGRLV